MNKKLLLTLWVVGFIVCAVCGFIPAEGIWQILLAILAVVSFVPGGLLLYDAHKQKDMDTVRLVRNLSLASLSLTMVLLILNLLSVRWAQWLGDMLYTVLLIVSAPMACGQNWLISMFLWACLLVTSVAVLMKPEK